MSCLDVLRRFVDELCDIVDQLGSSFPPPHIVAQGEGFVDRHEPQHRTNGLACYLKAAKICSTLNGALVLLDSGYVQEAHALGRIAQDQVEDIHFLVRPRGDDDRLSARQTKALDEFFQEEFTDPADPIGTSQDRDRVARDKVRAAVIDSEFGDPSSARAIGKAIYKMFSGYVHGAYGHVMELHCGDRPGRYNFHGANLSHLADAIDYFPNFVFQAALAVQNLVDRSSRQDLLPRIRSLSKQIATEFDVLPERKA